jgi:DNA-binding MurR/RpiR family transcriptional regulator
MMETMTAEPTRMTVAQLVHDHLSSLSPAERRVARALLADYPSAGLATVSDLAESAGVSAPTVVRFAQKLGWAGFPHLQQHLRAELTLHAGGPLSRARWQPEPGSNAELLNARARQMADVVLDSLAAIPSGDLDAAIELLSDGSRWVYLTGGRFTRVLAEYLARHLEQIRPRVCLLRDPWGADYCRVLDLGRRDVFLLCDVERYERSTVALAQEVKRRGATTILITDVAQSPASSHSDLVLRTAITSPSPFDSLATAFFLVELLMVPVMERLGDTAKSRMLNWEGGRGHELV